MATRTSSKRILLSTVAALGLGGAAAVPAAHAATAGDTSIGTATAQTVYLALRNEAGAEEYARDVQTPGALYHKFLSRSEFVKRFAPTNADIAKVESALTQLGYTINYVFPNHLGIQVTAPASDRKSTRLNSSHSGESRMPSSA